MKAGSTVELVNDDWNTNRFDSNLIKYPIKNKPYTIRQIFNSKYGVAIRLEEIINPKLLYGNGYSERAFHAYRFRELLPPIQNIEQYISQNTIKILEPTKLNF